MCECNLIFFCIEIRKIDFIFFFWYEGKIDFVLFLLIFDDYL